MFSWFYLKRCYQCEMLLIDICLKCLICVFNGICPDLLLELLEYRPERTCSDPWWMHLLPATLWCRFISLRNENPLQTS